MIDQNTLAGLGVGGVLAGILIFVLREVIAQHKKDMAELYARSEKREDRQLNVLETNAAANSQLVPALTALVQAVAQLAQHIPAEWKGEERRQLPPHSRALKAGGISDGSDNPR